LFTLNIFFKWSIWHGTVGHTRIQQAHSPVSVCSVKGIITDIILMCVCVHIYIYIYIHTHTHTHTQGQADKVCLHLNRRWMGKDILMK